MPFWGHVWLSVHAQRRCAQRGLTPQDVEYVLDYGHWRTDQKRGAIIVVLRQRDIPGPDRNNYARLVGTKVVLSQDARTVITVYRRLRRRRSRSRNDLPHAM